MRAKLDKIANEQLNWEKVMNFRREKHITYSLVTNAMFLRRNNAMYYKSFHGFRLAHARLFGPRICFDLSFVREQNPAKRRMAAGELLSCSLTNQLMKVPFHLCFTNADSTLESELQAFDSYDEGKSLKFDYTAKSYMDLFPKERLVVCKSSNRY